MRKIFQSVIISNNQSKEVAERKLQNSKKAWKGQQNETRKPKIQKQQEINSLVHFIRVQN